MDDTWEEEFVKVANPRSGTAVVPAPRRGEPRSALNAKPKAPALRKVTLAPTITPTVPAIKFGPPKGKKRILADAPISSSTPTTQALPSNHALTAPEPAAQAFDTEQCRSRGPTPLVSRPPTPISLTEHHVSPPAAASDDASKLPEKVVDDNLLSSCSSSGMLIDAPLVTSESARAVSVPAIPTADTLTPNIHLSITSQDETSITTPPSVSSAQLNEGASSPNMHALSTNAPPAPDTFHLPTPPGSITVPNIDIGGVSISQKEHTVSKRKGPTLANSTAKQRKVSARSASGSSVNSDHSSSTGLPSGAPAWVTNALKMFTSADLGPQWELVTFGPQWELVTSAWLKFEQDAQFDSSSRLGARHRPQIVTDWMKRARLSSYRPEIDAKALASDFSAWWKNLQPEWREVNNRTHSGDWVSYVAQASMAF